MAANLNNPTVTEKPKKKAVNGRKREFTRDLRLKNHVIGITCNCVSLKCFEVTTEDDRVKLISYFNNLKTKDEQDLYISSLVSVHSIKRRQSRNLIIEQSKFHSYSYKYHLNIVRDKSSTKICVCIKAFISIYGLTENCVRRIKEVLSATGM